MIIQIILALFIGVLFGTITGLTPGIHINLIGAIIISSIYLINNFNPILLVIFIVAMSITHTFIDFIPSVFLGAPNEDTVLSILPGHQLLKKGEGYKAIVYTTYGSLSAIMVIIILAPIFLIFLSKFDNVLSKLIPYLLILSTIFLISKESQKINAIIVLLISGFLGIAVLNSNLNQPFLPLLSGLFGSSSIILSLKSKTKIPQQKNKKIKIKKKGLIKPVLASAFASPFCTLLPGIGSGQAAIIGTSIIKPTKKNFLILLGATNTIVVGLSFIVFYAIGKTRTGVAAVISEITGNLNTNLITTILVTILITGIISFYWTLFLARQISNKINKLNYSYLSIFILIIISLIVFIFTGFFGIFIFLISTATGIYGILSGAKRINLMGCLILPVLLWYLI